MFNITHYVLFQNGDAWIAQLLEKDLNGQGSTKEEALHSLKRTIWGQMEVDKHFGHILLGDLGPAPSIYWSMERCQLKLFV
ncbi:MAG: hypothetical protein WC551_07685 [Patescibacteria group bacterium]